MKRLLLILIFSFYFVGTTFAAIQNEAVFNWVEYKFPELFPASLTVSSDITADGVHYDVQSYSGAWGTSYIGITDDGEIFGLGDYTNDALTSFGYIEDWEDAINADNEYVYRFDINEALQATSLTSAGTWVTKPENEVHGNGQLGLFGKSLLKVNHDEKYSVAMVGWTYQGWHPDLAMGPTTNMVLLSPNDDGTLYLNTDTYIDDPITNGSANIIVADFNEDGRNDMFLPAHNESPFADRPSVAYMSNDEGTFDTVRLDDLVTAHGATLVYLDDEPVVYTSTYNTQSDQHPIYRYEDGQFNAYDMPNMSRLNGADRTVLFDHIANKKYLVSSEVPEHEGWNGEYWERVNIGFFKMDENDDILSTEPYRLVTPYLSTLDEYENYLGMMGHGQTHNFKVFADDVNHDGRDDLVATTTMWTVDREDYPSSIDIILASENGFYNATEQLASNLPKTVHFGDHSPIVFDIDNSGIETYFLWSEVEYIQGSTSVYDHVTQGNYVLLNDGTGKLYVGLHDEFFEMTEAVLSFGNTSYTDMFPYFVAIPQTDGSVNFLAIRQTGGPDEVLYALINIPIHWNPTVHFDKDITIIDRNNSKLMRTWAGDDVIYDANANSPAHIDGGFGINMCVYSGSSSQYTITENSDGSFSIVSDDGTIDDTLVNIKTVIFTDTEVDLSDI